MAARPAPHACCAPLRLWPPIVGSGARQPHPHRSRHCASPSPMASFDGLPTDTGACFPHNRSALPHLGLVMAVWELRPGPSQRLPLPRPCRDRLQHCPPPWPGWECPPPTPLALVLCPSLATGHRDALGHPPSLAIARPAALYEPLDIYERNNKGDTIIRDWRADPRGQRDREEKEELQLMGCI